MANGCDCKGALCPTCTSELFCHQQHEGPRQYKALLCVQPECNERVCPICVALPDHPHAGHKCEEASKVAKRYRQELEAKDADAKNRTQQLSTTRTEIDAMLKEVEKERERLNGLVREWTTAINELVAAAGDRMRRTVEETTEATKRQLLEQDKKLGERESLIQTLLGGHDIVGMPTAEILAKYEKILHGYSSVLNECPTERIAVANATVNLSISVERIKRLLAEYDFVERMGAAEATKDDALGSLRAEVATINAAVASLRTEAATKDAALAALRAEAVTKDTALAALRAEAVTKDTAMATLRAEAVTKDATLATLRAETVTKDAALATLRTTSEQLLRAVVAAASGFKPAGSALPVVAIDESALHQIVPMPPGKRAAHVVPLSSVRVSQTGTWGPFPAATYASLQQRVSTSAASPAGASVANYIEVTLPVDVFVSAITITSPSAISGWNNSSGEYTKGTMLQCKDAAGTWETLGTFANLPAADKPTSFLVLRSASEFRFTSTGWTLLGGVTFH